MFRFVGGFECVSAALQYLGLDLQEIGLNGSSAADAPQQGRKPEHELTLDGCSGIVVRDDGCFECSVVLDILDILNDGFRAQSVPNRVSPRPAFALIRVGTGASDGVAPVGLDLPE